MNSHPTICAGASKFLLETITGFSLYEKHSVSKLSVLSLRVKNAPGIHFASVLLSFSEASRVLFPQVWREALIDCFLTALIISVQWSCEAGVHSSL